MRRWTIWAVSLMAILGVAMGSVPPALARAPRTRTTLPRRVPASVRRGLPRMAGLRWHEDAIGRSPVAATGDAVLLSSSNGPPALMAIDGNTGQRTDLTAEAQCAPPLADTSDFLFSCPGADGGAVSTSYVLVDPRSGRATSLSAIGCSGTNGACAAVAFGRHWVEWSQNDDCGPEGEHCSVSDSYQNLDSGRFENALDGGGLSWDDPDAPALVQSMCRPLRVPVDWDLYSGVDHAGGVRFFGRFAVLESSPESGPPVNTIAECGSSFRLHLPAEFFGNAFPTGNDHLIAWLTSFHTIAYLDLATRRTGSWILPERIGPVTSVFVAGRRIFVGSAGRVAATWSAPLTTAG